MSRFNPNPELSDSKGDIFKCSEQLLENTEVQAKYNQAEKRKTGSPNMNDSMRIFVDITNFAPGPMRQTPLMLAKLFAGDKVDQKIDYTTIPTPKGIAHIETYLVDMNAKFDTSSFNNFPNVPKTMQELIDEPWRYSDQNNMTPFIRRFDVLGPIPPNFITFGAQLFNIVPPNMANGPNGIEISNSNFMKGDFKLATNNVYVVYVVPPDKPFASFRVLPQSPIVRAYIILETKPSCWLRVCKSLQGNAVDKVTNVTKRYCPSVISNSGSSTMACENLLKCQCEDDLDKMASSDPSCQTSVSQTQTMEIMETMENSGNGESKNGNASGNGDEGTNIGMIIIIVIALLVLIAGIVRGILVIQSQ
jgi:hypothetical protein